MVRSTARAGDGRQPKKVVPMLAPASSAGRPQPAHSRPAAASAKKPAHIDFDRWWASNPQTGVPLQCDFNRTEIRKSKPINNMQQRLSTSRRRPPGISSWQSSQRAEIYSRSPWACVFVNRWQTMYACWLVRTSYSISGTVFDNWMFEIELPVKTITIEIKT